MYNDTIFVINIINNTLSKKFKIMFVNGLAHQQ
jgi:hypothetical protein